MAIYPNEHPMNKVVAGVLCPGRPNTVLQRLKEVYDAYNRPPSPTGGYKPPEWYISDMTSVNPSGPLCRLLKDAIDEIEMHQRINGDLYRQLFPGK